MLDLGAAGKHHVAVTERRTRKDWAQQIKAMLDERYPEARKVRLIMDNLNTHTIASLYETFEPQEAHRLASRLEIHHTPKHGSWLNVAEIGLSVLKGQCLDRRIVELTRMQAEVRAWENYRNNYAKKTTVVGVDSLDMKYLSAPCACQPLLPLKIPRVRRRFFM